MWQSYLFGMHWKHEGKLYHDELPADTIAEAAQYFLDHKRDDVALIAVELIGPNEGGVRESAHPSNSPFRPLIARRRLDVDDNAR